MYELEMKNILGFKIEVGTAGNIENPVIVFAHGLGGNLKQWDKQVEYFSKDYFTITFSLQGHGNSTKTDLAKDYKIESYSEVVMALMDELTITSCIWVGNSMGGVIGYDILKRRPKLISQIITNGTAPALKYSKSTLKMIGMMDRLLLKVIGFKRYIDIAVNASFKNSSKRVLLKDLFMSAHPLAIVESHQLLGKYNYLDVLEHADIPITLILTPNDKDINKAIKNHYDQLIKMKMINIVKEEQGGHIYNMEEPENYNKSIDGCIIID